MSQYTVPLKTIVEELDLEIVRKSSHYEEKVITKADVMRPALQLAGFYN